MPDRKDKNGGEDVSDREKQASDKLEESLKKEDTSGKPKGPEDAKKKSEEGDSDPY
ncbi:hypothetical protein BH20ACT10_BH20ACT10_23110 [soil metagenome]